MKRGDLRVTTDEEDGSWAAGCGLVEEALHLADSCWIGSAWIEVGDETSIVVDTLNSDVGCTECALEALTGWWTNGASLLKLSM